MSPSHIRLLLVDDYALLREVLTLVFATEADFIVVGEAASGREAIDLCERLQPDVVLMDLQMPEMDGLTATRILHEKYPHINVIAFTSLSGEVHVETALEAGAKKLLFKDATVDRLHSAVREVARGVASGAAASH